MARTTSQSILVVDDDPVQRRLLQAACERAGHAVTLAEDGEHALSLLDGHAAIVLDLLMPGMSGLDVLAALSEREDAPPVIVQTAQGGIETAVQAMRAGAFDFVVKPVSPERLAASLANALRFGASDRQRTLPHAAKAKRLADLAGRSPAMARAALLADRAAASDIPVLIEGESGVGKEVLARAIRDSSARRNKPFVTVNCGAIPESLVESILFGHEKGAFTGASERHIGKFVEADGGTLFLDEIGDLPPAAQVKLLRAVQEGEVEPVGARQPVRVDIRIISATHRDLAKLVEERRFREDLYYRLAVFPIHVPPLRQRRPDIARLTAEFLARISAEQAQGRIVGISGEALELLSRHDWPGNVRQLENAVFRAIVLSDGPELTPDDFPQIRAQMGEIDVWTRELAAPTDTARDAASLVDPFDADGELRSLEAIEEAVIRLAVERYEGRMSEVARRLGIGRSTLYRRLREMGIDPDGARHGSFTKAG